MPDNAAPLDPGTSKRIPAENKGCGAVRDHGAAFRVNQDWLTVKPPVDLPGYHLGANPGSRFRQQELRDLVHVRIPLRAAESRSRMKGQSRRLRGNPLQSIVGDPRQWFTREPDSARLGHCAGTTRECQDRDAGRIGDRFECAAQCSGSSTSPASSSARDCGTGGVRIRASATCCSPASISSSQLRSRRRTPDTLAERCTSSPRAMCFATAAMPEVPR